MDSTNGVAMFSRKWCTSERKYGMIAEYDVKIPMSDGVTLSCDVFRPDSDEKFPAILGYHPYHNPGQTGPLMPGALATAHKLPPGADTTNAALEAGDPNFYARRGYVHVVCNVRGTGKSEGKWDFVGPREVQDGYEVVEWMASQPWCDGKVGMFGVSYFAWIQFFVASTQPPHLKCIFAPWGATDLYRDVLCRGGVPAFGWPIGWGNTALIYGNCRPECHSRKELGETKFKKALEDLLKDDDLRLAPDVANVLRHPDDGINGFIIDLIMHPNYDKFWKERTVQYDKIKVPAYIGACWATYGIHLPGAFRGWEKLKVPKKMVIAPTQLDRPVYQMQYESLRWFDYWMKGMDTRIMDEPDVRLFVQGTGEWKQSTDWPLPETKWTPFYLHEKGLLSEHEHWPNEGSDSFEDSPWGRGAVKYVSPAMVENTEVTGPIALKVYASSTDPEIFWIVSLFEQDPEGKEFMLTKGWLRGTHRELDPARSTPWRPSRKHDKNVPLVPNQIYDFDIRLLPTSFLFKAGYRIVIKLSCVDDPPQTPLQFIAGGALKRQSPSRITVYHDADHPSHLLLPITKGNVLGTFMSGGKFA
jgi:putative CocE/NonD family hydrolase